MTQEFLTTTELIEAARRNLSPAAWGRLDSGTETETTVARNRLAFDSLALRPRVLVDVTTIDPSTTFLGLPLRIPVLLAPIGTSHDFTPGGVNDIASAAAAFGTVPMLAAGSKGVTWEEAGSATPGPKILQMAFVGTEETFRDAIGRVRDAGYVALCFAFDTPRLGRSEREMLVNHQPVKPMGALRTGMSWAVLERLLPAVPAGLPLIAKGITHPDDAVRLVEMGFRVIYVGNHGGANLDHMVGAMDALPDVVAAVGDRADVIIDGGVMRGTDVAKALALGARAVAIARLQCCGLGATRPGGGPEGLVRLLELLEGELVHVMTYLGTPRVGEIGPGHVLRGQPAVAVPGVFSAFPLLDWNR